MKLVLLVILEKFEQNEVDFVDFKLNYVFFVGINVFFFCYWRKGWVIKIDIDDYKWKVFIMKDCENGKVNFFLKYLLCLNMF